MRALLRPLAYEVYALAVDQATMLRRRSLPDPPLRLNLGCGPDVRPGWVNVDLDRRADLQVDLRERVPLPDGCASVIVAEHTFEHFSYPRDTTRFLAECRRLLQPGGLLALSVPDAEVVLRRYAAGDRAYFDYARERWSHPAQHSFTPLASINFQFRQNGQHQYAHDAETLIRILEDNGFADAHVRDFDPEFDTPERREGSLLVSAMRP
jgi:predicted SAM-dependent methyltransferase